MKQSTRKEIAKKTLDTLEKGYYINADGNRVDIKGLQNFAESNTKLFKPDELEALLTSVPLNNTFKTDYEVTNETTLDAARRLVAAGQQDVLCLNFASAKNPGGGFLGGALAQEECIARASGLYPCLLQASEYYTFHRNLETCLYSDHMIYSPAVPVIKDEEGELLPAPVCVTIITSPAVNAGVVRRNEIENIGSILPVMKVRIEKLLALCAHKQHSTLVLGAWGCGVFQNDPGYIAQLFKEALTNRFAGQFKKVVFAVYTNKEEMIDAFRTRFL